MDLMGFNDDAIGLFLGYIQYYIHIYVCLMELKRLKCILNGMWWFKSNP
jgi:hypothetical protein